MAMKVMDDTLAMAMAMDGVTMTVMKGASSWRNEMTRGWQDETMR